MKTRLLLAALVAAHLAACVDDRPVVQPKHVCSPPDDATACAFEDSCGAVYLGEYVFDVAQAPRLTLFVEVENQLLPNGDPDTGRVNTHDAYVQRVSVSYRGALPLPDSGHRLQRLIPAGGTGVVTLFPITEATAAEIATLAGAGGLAAGASAQIVAEVRLGGQYGDLTDFETAIWELPIRVCNGCTSTFGCSDPSEPFLVTCPPDLVTLQPIQGQLPMSAGCVGP